ncbi:MAG: hypothetical protein QXQ14_02825 [Candidatus Aenigmatarchaeota archaeon]
MKTTLKVNRKNILELFNELYKDVSEYLGVKVEQPKVEINKKGYDCAYDFENNIIYIRSKRTKEELKYCITEEIFHYLFFSINPSIKQFFLSENDKEEKFKLAFLIEVITKYLIFDFFKKKGDKAMIKYIQENRILQEEYLDKYKRIAKFLLKLDISKKENKSRIYKELSN